jgi:hypothetical protein
MKKILAFIALAVAFSANANAAGVWKYGMQIQAVQSLVDGGFIIYGPSGSAPTCPEGRLFFVRSGLNGQTPAGLKTNLAMVMTAFGTGKTVSFEYDNVNCGVGTLLMNP